jgi:hypothetical protein
MDSSLRSLPDPPSGGFETQLRVAQVRSRIAIVLGQNLSPGRMQLVKNRIL